MKEQAAIAPPPQESQGRQAAVRKVRIKLEAKLKKDISA